MIMVTISCRDLKRSMKEIFNRGVDLDCDLLEDVDYYAGSEADNQILGILDRANEDEIKVCPLSEVGNGEG